MAAPSVTTLVPIEWAGDFTEKQQFLTNLWDTRADANYTTRTGALENVPLPKPGAVRVEDAVIGRGPYEQVWCDGACWFQWCLNRTGATLNQFDLVSRPVLTTGQIATGGTVNTITDAGLTEDELVHTIVTITADVGGANAAPENESAYVVRNTTTVINVQPDFTVAPANLDQYCIYYPYNIEAAAAGDVASEVRGVVMRYGGIADNYWGWVGFMGRIWAQVNGALTQHVGLIAGVGMIGPAVGGATNLVIGRAPVPISTAEAQAMVELKCGYALESEIVP